MFSSALTVFATPAKPDRSFKFTLKGSDEECVMKLVRSPKDTHKAAARSVLVNSFITEYRDRQKLTPQEIDRTLTSWEDGENSVRKYYLHYFEEELHEFSHGKLDYWIEATIDNQLVGFATFVREKQDENAVYMNLLAVDPKHQHRSIGQKLVYALTSLNELRDITAINLLLRIKNKGGEIFYEKLGFSKNPNYRRDNFVDTSLLVGFTWNRPALENRA